MSHRPAMVATEIRKIVAQFAREIPPDISGFVSVTEVDMSPDLSHANIYVSALDRATEAIEFLTDNKGELKRRISKAVSGYKLPELRFVIDDRPERGNRVDEILKRVNTTDH